MSELNESVHVVFDDSTVITVPLVTNLTATNAAPTAKTVGDALAGKVDAESVMQHVRITVDGVQSDNQGVILIDGSEIPVDDTENAPSIKDAIDAVDQKTAADIKYQATGSDTIKTVVDGIAEDVGDIQGKLYGDQIPMTSAAGAQTVQAAVQAVDQKTASTIIYDGATTIKAKVDALDSAVTGMDLNSVVKTSAQDFTEGQKTQARTNIGAADAATVTPVVEAFAAGFPTLLQYLSEDISDSIPLYGEGTAITRLNNACWLYRFGHMVIISMAIQVDVAIGADMPILAFPSVTVGSETVTLAPSGAAHVIGMCVMHGHPDQTVPLYRNGQTVCVGTAMAGGVWRGFLTYCVD